MKSAATPLPDFAELASAVAQRQDRAAFAVLFDHFAPRLQAFLIGLRMDQTSAEEVTQDVMMTLWHKAHLYDPQKSSLSTWLYRIARNRRIDHLRKGRLSFADDIDTIPEPADTSTPNPEAAFAVQDQEALLREAMALLPIEQLDLVKLAFFEGLSHAEVAVRTGLPLGTVKSRIRLAFTRLRRTLEASGIDDAQS